MSKKADIQRHARQEFAAPGSAFDRMIGILRIALPTAVGMLLAILAIAPVERSNEFSFMLDRNEVAMAPERLRVAQALYRGEDAEGRPFSLRANSARQRTSQDPLLEVQGMEAEFSVGSGRASVSAQRGDYDLSRDLMRIRGPLQFNRDNGDAMTATNVVVDLKGKRLRSVTGATTPVRGRTGFGTFRSDSLFASLPRRTMTLTGNVAGTTDFGNYSARRLTYDFETDDVVLEGNARLRIR